MVHQDILEPAVHQEPPLSAANLVHQVSAEFQGTLEPAAIPALAGSLDLVVHLVSLEIAELQERLEQAVILGSAATAVPLG